MIIIAGRYGQLGNKLFVFAHFIAWAMEYKATILNPSFYKYAEYFDGTRGNILCKFPGGTFKTREQRLTRAIFYWVIFVISEVLGKISLGNGYWRIIKINDTERVDLSSPEFVSIAFNSKLVVAKGWLFRDNKNFNKHATEIRDFFRPKKEIRDNVEHLINRARINCDVLIGVHIRHGDYKQFAEGKYFYEAGEYANIMGKVSALFPDKQVVFLICSNAPQDASIFSRFKVIFGNNHLVEDMYSFAQCDYVIGPPSTYTQWASFYGQVPLYHLEHPHAILSLDSFTVA